MKRVLSVALVTLLAMLLLCSAAFADVNSDHTREEPSVYLTSSAATAKAGVNVVAVGTGTYKGTNGGYPEDIKFSYDVAGDEYLYIYEYNFTTGAWVCLGHGAKGQKNITVHVNQFNQKGNTYGFGVSTAAGTAGSTVSPSTGEGDLPYVALCVGIAAAAAAVLVARRKRVGAA